jgi:hypothetical protein
MAHGILSGIQGKLFRIASLAFAASCLAVTLSCTMAERPPTTQTPEEIAGFHQLLLDHARMLDKYILQSQHGSNVSEFSMGWIVYDILLMVNAQDDDLYDYFNSEHINVETYLKTVFRDHPDQQIAGLDAMIDASPSTLRRIARQALDTLRHIPNGKEPPEIQARDRTALLQALVLLKQDMEQAAAETQ